MPELVDAAFAAKTKAVLLVIVATVPIVTLPVVFMILPTLSSVVNKVPTPVTFLFAVDVEIVPVRETFDQVAPALQLPFATLVTVAACTPDAAPTRNITASNAI